MYEENAPIKYVQPQTLAAMSSSLAKRVHNQCRNCQFYITAQCGPPAIPYIILVYLQWMNCQGLVSSDLVCHYRLVLWRSTHLGLVGRSFYDFDPDATWNGQHGDKRCWPCCQRWRYCMEQDEVHGCVGDYAKCSKTSTAIPTQNDDFSTPNKTWICSIDLHITLQYRQAKTKIDQILILASYLVKTTHCTRSFKFKCCQMTKH